MKKIVALSLAFVAFLGAKEIKSKEVFLSDAASVDSLRQFLKANKEEIVKLNLSYCANENSLKILEKNANERKGGVKFSGIAEDYKPSKTLLSNITASISIWARAMTTRVTPQSTRGR